MKQLAWVADWYIRNETYAKALAEITISIMHIPFSGQFARNSKVAFPSLTTDNRREPPL
ncbi:transposase [Shimazuella sp. AN120528]|nr:transposase [Shimazuella soli]